MLICAAKIILYINDLTITIVDLGQRTFPPCICIVSAGSEIVFTYTIEALLNRGFYKDSVVFVIT